MPTTPRTAQGTSARRCRYRRMRALLVHNPTAGTKSHDKDSIVAALRLAKFKVDYISTKDGGVKDALKDAHDLVVAGGGDGTVAFVFTNLHDRSIPIGVLPLGSANNIARSLGIAGTPQELTERWRIDQTRPFNLMTVDSLDEPVLCTEAFGVGLFAALIKRRAKGKPANGADDLRRGRRALSEIIAEAEPLDIEVTIDGKAWEGDLLGAEVLNTPFTGPALLLAGNADPGDPLLDVVAIEHSGREALVEWIETPHDYPAPVKSRKGKRIELRWRNAESRVDDQASKAGSDWQRVTVRCTGDPLRILVPAQHPGRYGVTW